MKMTLICCYHNTHTEASIINTYDNSGLSPSLFPHCVHLSRWMGQSMLKAPLCSPKCCGRAIQRHVNCGLSFFPPSVGWLWLFLFKTLTRQIVFFLLKFRNSLCALLCFFTWLFLAAKQTKWRDLRFSSQSMSLCLGKDSSLFYFCNLMPNLPTRKKPKFVKDS